jgi:putative pyruvate formate lyase activating enzyme
LKIKIFRSGIHFGEERIIQGNHSSGMITFSGCHLSCNFCYTPETSVHKIGVDLTPSEFFHVTDDLVRRGARNINLISPTHVWQRIQAPLSQLKEQTGSALPLVLKISGFEKPSMISKMACLADIFVPDFKAFSRESAIGCGLPHNYGSVALRAIREIMMTHHDTLPLSSNKLARGILVRHLMMPDHFEDSIRVVGALADIGFTGYLNLMTYFIDTKTGSLSNASPEKVHLLANQANRFSMKVLVNGKETSPNLAKGDLHAGLA